MKKDLATLALMGMSAGIMVTGCQNQHEGEKRSNQHMMATEQLPADMQAFYSALSPEAQEKFMQLDAQHKMMAVEMSNQNCSAQNKCAGMGGCANVSHQCAGQNGCKGQGGAPIQDANKAVNTQHHNQAAQRQKLNEGLKH